MGYITEIRKKIGHDELIGVGCGIITYRGNQVLLQQRSDNGCWTMHGGALEMGETVEEAARRELWEETGLTANEVHLLGVFSGQELRFAYPNGDKLCLVQIIYVCDDFSGDLQPDPEETLGLKWFDIDHMPENINKVDKIAFEQFTSYIKNKNKE